jgi:hypothetical protein
MPNRGRNELAGTVPSSTSNCRVLISTDSDALTQLDTPGADATNQLSAGLRGERTPDEATTGPHLKWWPGRCDVERDQVCPIGSSAPCLPCPAGSSAP